MPRMYPPAWFNMRFSFAFAVSCNGSMQHDISTAHSATYDIFLETGLWRVAAPAVDL